MTLRSIERLLNAQPGQVIRSDTWATQRSQEGDMTTSALTIRATITKGHDGSDGYAVSVTLKENGIRRQLIDKVVPSCFEAETVARAFATQNNVLWHKVELIYR